MSHRHVATEAEARAMAGDVPIDRHSDAPFVPGFPYEVCGGTGPKHGPHIWHHAREVADPLRHMPYWTLFEVVIERPQYDETYPGVLAMAKEWARQRDAGLIDVEGARKAEHARRIAEMERNQS